MIKKKPQYPKDTEVFNTDGRGRTGTGITTHGILNPGRLPIPPHRHVAFTTIDIIAHNDWFVNSFFEKIFRDNSIYTTNIEI